MAVTNVTYTLNNQTQNMASISDGTFQAKARSPSSYGNYAVTVKAYDDSGNISVLTIYLTVSEWITPKTDWKIDDRFNIVDFNRIRSNFLYLHNISSKVYGIFDIEYMGEAINTEKVWWNVDYFNAFEENLDIINKHIYTQDYGIRKTFYENGIFIDWQELNRIESACLSMKKIIEAQAEAIRNLPFRLGAYKEVRI